MFKYDQVILSLQYRLQPACLTVTCYAAGQQRPELHLCVPVVSGDMSALLASKIGVMRNAYGIMMRKPFGRLSVSTRWEDNIKTDISRSI
jgi:Single-stranded DNA-binding replication protein A (RPA), medium (30 kD) subunit